MQASDMCQEALQLLDKAFRVKPMNASEVRKIRFAKENRRPIRKCDPTQENFTTLLTRRILQAKQETGGDPGTVYTDFAAEPLGNVDLGAAEECDRILSLCPSVSELLVVTHTRHHPRFLAKGDILLSVSDGERRLVAPSASEWERMLDVNVRGCVDVVMMRTISLKQPQGSKNTVLDNVKFSACYDTTTQQTCKQSEECPYVLEVESARPDDPLCVGDVLWLCAAESGVGRGGRNVHGVGEKGVSLRREVAERLDKVGSIRLHVKRRVRLQVKTLNAVGVIPLDLDLPDTQSYYEIKPSLVVHKSIITQVNEGNSLVAVHDPRKYPLYGDGEPIKALKKAVCDKALLSEILKYSIGVELIFEWQGGLQTPVVVQESLILRQDEIHLLAIFLWNLLYSSPWLYAHVSFHTLRAFASIRCLLIGCALLSLCMVGWPITATVIASVLLAWRNLRKRRVSNLQWLFIMCSGIVLCFALEMHSRGAASLAAALMAALCYARGMPAKEDKGIGTVEAATLLTLSGDLVGEQS